MAFTVVNTSAYLTDEARAHLAENACRVEDRRLARLTDEDYRAAMRGVAGVIAGGPELWPEKAFELAGALKIIARTGVGVDNVDLAAATEHGVWVTNTPTATSTAVADFTLGLILSLLRNIPAMARDMKRGEWNQFCGRELGSLTLGVIGTGSIGREVVIRATGFGARILAYDILPDDEFAEKWQLEYVGLDELMAQSDVISLHVPLTGETRGLIDERRLGLMKMSSYLVNTSRPAVVDKEALVAALKARSIAGAAIDVHDPAPCRPDDPLVALDNVIATPWTAYKTQECISRMCITAARDVVAVLHGDRPRFPVNNP